jgi:predicted ABC-type exoprotein transport system permease subunit
MASMKDNTKKINYSLVTYVALAALLALLCAPIFQPVYVKSKDAAVILATVLAILAGFLVAVMAIVADERTLRGKNWRQDTYYLQEADRQLTRHKLMFHLYLIVLVLIFVISLDLPWPASWQIWTERVMLFLATFSLLLSFRLPGELTSRQISQLRRMIDDRRTRDSGDSE